LHMERSYPTDLWSKNRLVSGNIFAIVQFLTLKPGITLLATGDSHIQGTSTTEQFSSFVYRATTTLRRRVPESGPIGMVNCAVGGMTSEEFFCRFEGLVRDVSPSCAILPGWTFNDGTGVNQANRRQMELFIARLLLAIETCKSRGILPIILTPFPRGLASMTTERLEAWRWVRKQIMSALESTEIVIDATALLGNDTEHGDFDGTYLPSLSTDQIHPNDRGHSVLAEALIARFLS
jgi:hypothetical protein